MGKYIDVENINAHEYVTTWDCNCSEYGRQRVMAIDDINYLPTVDIEPANQWISINDERKPKNLHEYLCLCSFENSTPEEFCWVTPLIWHAFEGNGLVDRPHFTDEGVEGMRVTHWMELPPPPKGIKRYR